MLEILIGIGQSILQVFYSVWWLVLPLFLMFIFWDFWLYYAYVGYARKLKWVLLEIKVPTGIEKSPKAMEQVFAAVYQIYSFGIKPVEKYWGGKFREDFMSFEIVGQSGGVHFYVRCLAGHRNLIESAIYAQYSDAEIVEAQDYRSLWSKVLPNAVYDVAGTDYQFVKDSAYPIRTYEYFEESQEEKRLDPIAAMTEVMSRLQKDEALWVQIFVRPPAEDNDWKREVQELINKIIDRKKPASPPGILGGLFQFFRNLIVAPTEYPLWPEAEKSREQSPRLLSLTPGERESLEAIEKKMNQINFDVNLRFVYIDRRDSFTPLNVSATMSTFNQFNTYNLNSFMPKVKTFTLSPAGYKGLVGLIAPNVKWIKKKIIWYRKRKLWDGYMKLFWSGGKTMRMSIEELATIYHFPSIFAKSPLIRRVPSKKGEPPPGLPVE